MRIDIPNATAPAGVTLPAYLDFSPDHERLALLLHTTYAQLLAAPVPGASDIAATAIFDFPAAIWGGLAVTSSRIQNSANGFNFTGRIDGQAVNSGRITIKDFRDSGAKSVTFSDRRILRLARDLQLLLAPDALTMLRAGGFDGLADALQVIKDTER